jgi:hypothetical protein
MVYEATIHSTEFGRVYSAKKTFTCKNKALGHLRNVKWDDLSNSTDSGNYKAVILDNKGEVVKESKLKHL